MSQQQRGSSFGALLPPDKDDADDGPGLPASAVVILCTLALVEGMDIVLIGVSQAAFFVDIEGWNFWVQGYLGIAQGIFQNAGAVVWGISADRGYMSRKNILCLAAGVQALCTLALTPLTTTFWMWPIRIANGFFLAALRPISNGIVADMVRKEEQGFYFGLMQAFWTAGLNGIAMAVGPVAIQWFLVSGNPVKGWRIAFVLVSSFAIFASIGAVTVMPQMKPPVLSEEELAQNPAAVAVAEMKKMVSFFKYPSFVLMIVQGIFGSVPWLVLGNLTLYLLITGFDPNLLIYVFFCGFFGVPGAFLGGMVSDALVNIPAIGSRGRPLSAVLSVGMSVPIQYYLWQGLDPEGSFFSVGYICAIMAVFNLVSPWAQPGCNFPVLGQIVTGPDRNKVMCWEMAFENSAAAIIGNLAVPVLFDYLEFELPTYTGKTDMEMARNLGYGQALIICSCWSICFCVYSLLIWSFPRDLARLEEEAKNIIV